MCQLLLREALRRFKENLDDYTRLLAVSTRTRSVSVGGAAVRVATCSSLLVLLAFCSQESSTSTTVCSATVTTVAMYFQVANSALLVSGVQLQLLRRQCAVVCTSLHRTSTVYHDTYVRTSIQEYGVQCMQYMAVVCREVQYIQYVVVCTSATVLLLHTQQQK